jgi:hypothetical protein
MQKKPISDPLKNHNLTPIKSYFRPKNTLFQTPKNPNPILPKTLFQIPWNCVFCFVSFLECEIFKRNLKCFNLVPQCFLCFFKRRKLEETRNAKIKSQTSLSPAIFPLGIAAILNPKTLYPANVHFVQLMQCLPCLAPKHLYTIIAAHGKICNGSWYCLLGFRV